MERSVVGGGISVFREEAQQRSCDLGDRSGRTGGMGGMMGGNMQSTGGTTGLATAMSQFVGSAMNKSGVQVSDMQTLISRLNTSGGAIQ